MCLRYQTTKTTPKEPHLALESVGHVFPAEAATITSNAPGSLLCKACRHMPDVTFNLEEYIQKNSATLIQSGCVKMKGIYLCLWSATAAARLDENGPSARPKGRLEPSLLRLLSLRFTFTLCKHLTEQWASLSSAWQSVFSMSKNLALVHAAWPTSPVPTWGITAAFKLFRKYQEMLRNRQVWTEPLPPRALSTGLPL